jgi:hypothetical protein
MASEEARPIRTNPEAVFQNEIARILPEHTYGALIPAPEVFIGHGNPAGQKGRLDFLIRFQDAAKNQLWGIETLVNEDDVTGHYERFTQGGKYSSAGLDDFILLNFQNFLPKRAYRKFFDTIPIFTRNFTNIYACSQCCEYLDNCLFSGLYQIRHLLCTYDEEKGHLFYRTINMSDSFGFVFPSLRLWNQLESTFLSASFFSLFVF